MSQKHSNRANPISKIENWSPKSINSSPERKNCKKNNYLQALVEKIIFLSPKVIRPPKFSIFNFFLSKSEQKWFKTPPQKTPNLQIALSPKFPEMASFAGDFDTLGTPEKVVSHLWIVIGEGPTHPPHPPTSDPPNGGVAHSNHTIGLTSYCVGGSVPGPQRVAPSFNSCQPPLGGCRINFSYVGFSKHSYPRGQHCPQPTRWDAKSLLINFFRGLIKKNTFRHSKNNFL